MFDDLTWIVMVLWDSILCKTYSRRLVLAEFVAHNTIDVLVVKIPQSSFLSQSSWPTPCTISCYAWVCVLNQLELVNTIMDWIKSILEEAQINLTVTQKFGQNTYRPLEAR